MSVRYQDNFLVGAPKPIDDRYGPWQSLNGPDGPIQGIPLNFRHKGLTVGVIDNGAVKEYWWRDDTKDTDLILKTTSGSGVTAGLGLTGTTTISIDNGSSGNAIAQLKANLSNNIAGDAASVSKYPSVKSIKDYVDGSILGLLNDRGSYNPTNTSAYPTSANGGSGVGGAIMKGDIWYINTPGTIAGTSVTVGASIRALANNPGQTSTNWDIIDLGLGYIPENIDNKVKTLGEFTANITSQNKYPSINAIKLYIDDLNIGGTQGLNSVLQNGNEATDKNLTLTTSTTSTNNLLTVRNTYLGSTKKSVLEAGALSIHNTNTQRGLYGHNSMIFTNNSNISATLNITPAGQTIAFPSESGTLALVGDIPNTSTFLTTSTAAVTYVPYTGATDNVSLGNWGLYGFYIEGSTAVVAKPPYTTNAVSYLNYNGNGTTASGSVALRENSTGAGKLHNLGLLGISYGATRGWSLPDASGILLVTVATSAGNLLTGNNGRVVIPDAGSTTTGLITTGSQTIAGAKTFSNQMVVNADIIGNGNISGNIITGSSFYGPLAGGTNINAPVLNIYGARGTGSGTGGDINIATSNTGSSGSTAQLLSTKVIIKGTTGNVGIGVDPGSYKLYVAGELGANQITLLGTTRRISFSNTVTIGTVVSAGIDVGITFTTNSNERLRITENGSIGIGTASPNPSAKLHIDSTTQGVLVPRMTASQRTAISGPATGLLVYQTDGIDQGFYFYHSTKGWVGFQYA